MSEPSRSISILGSTGSIGKSTLEVVRESHGCFKVFALTANKHLALLCEQAAEFQAFGQRHTREITEVLAVGTELGRLLLGPAHEGGPPARALDKDGHGRSERAGAHDGGSAVGAAP